MSLRRSLSARLLGRVLPLLAAVVMAACSPIGKGTGPVRLIVNAPSGTVDAPAATIYECIRAGVTATLIFGDGSQGDFTSRVHWASSDSSVVRISNGDEAVPAPGTGFYGFGVMTPVKPGSATITATYQGLSDSIVVTVGTPTEITVKTVNPENGLGEVPANNTFRIGVGTSTDLTVTAKLGNVLTNLDSAANWVFDAPDDTVALINSSTGVVTGVAAGGPLVARATFSPCTMSASTTVSVAPVTALALVPEFGTDNLILGNNERYSVLADFGDGPEQNISTQVTLASSDATVASFSGGLLLNNLLVPLKVGGPIDLTATFTQGTGTGATTVTSPAVQATVVADTLQSIAVTPATASVVAGSAEVAQFHVVGTYASGQTQDITRLVSWATSDGTVGTIAIGGAQAGQAVSTGTTPGTTTLTATATVGTTTLTGTATLTTTAP